MSPWKKFNYVLGVKIPETIEHIYIFRFSSDLKFRNNMKIIFVFLGIEIPDKVLRIFFVFKIKTPEKT